MRMEESRTARASSLTFPLMMCLTSKQDGFSAVAIRPNSLEELRCPARGAWAATAGEVLKDFCDHVRVNRNTQWGVLWQPRDVFWGVQDGVEGLERFHELVRSEVVVWVARALDD